MARRDELIITSDNLLFDAGLKRSHDAFDKHTTAKEIYAEIARRAQENDLPEYVDYYMVTNSLIPLMSVGSFVTEVTLPSLRARYLEYRARHIAGELFNGDEQAS